MNLTDNPVLRRELRVGLRSRWGGVLMLGYVGLLGLVVILVWPDTTRFSPGPGRGQADRLVDLFLLSQYVLMAVLTPPLLAGSLADERRRGTYELLLTSRLAPGSILLGKLLAALARLAVLVFIALPLTLLCLPLGGVHPVEMVATYAALAASTALFGLVAMTASDHCRRTTTALLLSYMLILPLASAAVAFYGAFRSSEVFSVFVPAMGLLLAGLLFERLRRRMLRPSESWGASGWNWLRSAHPAPPGVHRNRIQQPTWLDRLFAPPRRDEGLPDRANPVFEKELRAELFGQGRLMLRWAVPWSVFAAAGLIVVCFFFEPRWAPWYVGYVIVFASLVAPVFSARMIAGERERATLDSLLCTALTPAEILWGKLLAGMRASLVLTSFVVWPMLLAWALPPWTYRADVAAMVAYLAVIVLSALTANILATFCSLLSRQTVTALLATYLVLMLLYGVPLAAEALEAAFAAGVEQGGSVAASSHPTQWLAPLSPIAVARSLPLWLGRTTGDGPALAGDWTVLFRYLAIYAGGCVVLLIAMFGIFRRP